MRQYEIAIIFDAGLEEEAMRAILDRVTTAVTDRGGNLGRVDRWGRRRFAYELAHRWEGYYVLLEVSSDPPAVDEAHRVLSLADEVLRHKVVRLPEGGTSRKASSSPPPATPAAAAG
ncbi:MAG: 30S ribosomal protein S6 [Acidimicrobiales bacterium]